jgi:hypothetical protein
MTKFKLFFLIAFLIVLSSCATQRKCNAKYPPSTSRDSIRIETIKEIPVYLPGDSIKINVPINCPDQNIGIIETDRLKQEIRILNGRLVSNTHIKKDTVFVPVKQIETVVNTVIVTKPVEFIPKPVKKLAWFGGISIFLIIAFLIWKGYNFISPKI